MDRPPTNGYDRRPRPPRKWPPSVAHLDLDIAGTSATLAIPDLSGETFETLVKERALDRTIDELLTSSDGTLYFVNPDFLHPRVTIVEATEMARKLGEEHEGASKKIPFLEKELPAETLAVEIIQAFLSRRRVVRSHDVVHRLGLIVSAWDVCKPEQMTPVEWVRARMPLLSQYLEVLAADGEAVEILGVSAQGGRYGVENLQRENPAERAFVVDGTGAESHDVTLPVRYVASDSTNGR